MCPQVKTRSSDVSLPVELRAELTPVAPFRLPAGGSGDGLLRSQGGVLHRLLHHDGSPVLMRAAQTAPDRVLIGARACSSTSAEYGIERMRFALGLDIDVQAFYRAFRDDATIGVSLRRRPWLRPRRRPQPFEALAWAICEQLIEYERAVAIERRLVFAFGRKLREGGVGALRDAPTPQALAGAAPALLQSFDLAGSRALSLVRAAREVAAGRVKLEDEDHERGWRRLRAIPGIGSWTVEMLALHGQGREDQVPAGDLGLLKRVGRLLSGGDPHAYADEAQVRRFFAPYGPWAGLAAMHVLMP